jgi:hypothetical protein
MESMEGKALEERVLKLPRIKLPQVSLPRPTRWDLFAAAVLVVGLVLIGLNLRVALSTPPGEHPPGWLTPFFVFAQIGVSCAGLLLLGKTAKEGTFWGNAASIFAMLAGMSGVLLAAALWATA